MAIELTKIEQIKMLRSFTGMGLVESKVSVELFAKAQGMIDNKITNMEELLHFAKFCSLFVNKQIEVDTDKYLIFPCFQKPLTDQQLYDMIKS